MSVLWHLFTSLTKSKQESKAMFFGSKHIFPFQSLSLVNLLTYTNSKEVKKKNKEVKKYQRST
jgi:hypothetical protein